MKNPIQLFRENRHSFRALQQLHNEIDHLFEEMASWTPEMEKNLILNPRCDVSEDEKQYELRFDLPGMQKEQIKVELSDDVLTVSAERKSQEETVEKKNGHRKFVSEVAYGSYARSFSLPKNVDEKSVKASYENGVLSVKVKKATPKNIQQIPVQ